MNLLVRHLRYMFIFFLFFQSIARVLSSHIVTDAAPNQNSTTAPNLLTFILHSLGFNTNARSEASSTFSDGTTRTSEGFFFKLPQLFRESVKATRNLAAEATASKLYDAIIVGGGSVGCPLARTLADAGKDVLLIERGKARKDHPETWDIYGAGIVIDNREVSQPILTTDGVISHVANVLSGGSAINMAIIIQEQDSYFDYLESLSGVSFDRNKLDEAFNWTLSWLAHPMPETADYGRKWRLGLDEVFGPHLPYRTQLETGFNWAGSTSFDPNNKWFRVGSDVALGEAGVDFPKTLRVLLNHNVHKIEFEQNPVTKAHRATCVQFAQTTKRDTAPLGRRKINILNLPILSLLGLFNRNNDAEFSAFIPTDKKYRACVKPGGEIISSAGALLTPLLMYRSGVGPKQFVSNLNVPLVKEIPNLGVGLRDRVFVPVGLFFKDPMPDIGHIPRICQSVGLDYVGFNCSDMKIGQKTLLCSLVTAEEISGARIAEGTIYATRYIVPPQIRNEPIVETMFAIAHDCSDGRVPLNNPLLSGLCILVRPLVDCFRKVAANFYFTAEPKSIGHIEVTSRGEFIVTGNYLTNPQDMQDAMRGLANIIRVINSGYYDDIFQPAGLNSCPMTILNGLINLADNEFMKSQDISGTRASKEALSEVKDFLYSALDDYEKETKEAEAWKQKIKGELHDTNLRMNDIDHDYYSEDADYELEGAWFNIFGPPSNTQTRPHRYWTSQRYATYPPTIPEPSDSEGLKKYAKSFMTSIWHWVGSAQLGVVVDDRFMVKGFENLRIVDASVLNQVTRMNPFFTLIALGRYAGLIINEDNIPSPPGSTM